MLTPREALPLEVDHHPSPVAGKPARLDAGGIKVHPGRGLQWIEGDGGKASVGHLGTAFRSTASSPAARAERMIANGSINPCKLNAYFQICSAIRSHSKYYAAKTEDAEFGPPDRQLSPLDHPRRHLERIAANAATMRLVRPIENLAHQLLPEPAPQPLHPLAPPSPATIPPVPRHPRSQVLSPGHRTGTCLSIAWTRLPPSSAPRG